MDRKPHIFGWDDEPTTERPTGYGQTSFGQSGFARSTTTAAAWVTSQHSTFDQPSVSSRKREVRAAPVLHVQPTRPARPGLVAAALLTAAAIAAAALLALLRN